MEILSWKYVVICMCIAVGEPQFVDCPAQVSNICLVVPLVHCICYSNWESLFWKLFIECLLMTTWELMLRYVCVVVCPCLWFYVRMLCSQSCQPCSYYWRQRMRRMFWFVFELSLNFTNSFVHSTHLMWVLPCYTPSCLDKCLQMCEWIIAVFIKIMLYFSCVKVKAHKQLYIWDTSKYQHAC